MEFTLLVHIIAGGIGLVAGFLALYAAKGATLHRRVGVVFVYTMVTMSAAGVAIAAELVPRELAAARHRHRGDGAGGRIGAVWIPARRASTVHPVVALQTE